MQRLNRGLGSSRIAATRGRYRQVTVVGDSIDAWRERDGALCLAAQLEVVDDQCRLFLPIQCECQITARQPPGGSLSERRTDSSRRTRTLHT